jgi:hypothetical protein
MNDNDSIPTPGKGVTSIAIFGAGSAEIHAALEWVRWSEADFRGHIVMPPMQAREVLRPLKINEREHLLSVSARVLAAAVNAQRNTNFSDAANDGGKPQ